MDPNSERSAPRAPIRAPLPRGIRQPSLMPCATSAFLAGTAPRLTSEPVGVSVNNQPFLRYAPLVLSMFAAGTLAACGGSSNDASRTGSPQPTESSAGAQQG